MLPVTEDEEIGGLDDDADDGLSHLLRTGQIPSSLLKEILEEAGHYMALYNTSPSTFLNRSAKTKYYVKKVKIIILSQQLMNQKRTEQHPLKKKMTTGIMSLTRPRFGKRSMVGVSKVGRRFSKRSLHGPSYVLRFLLTQDPKLKRVLKNEGLKDVVINDEEMR